jgi:hypothetical protein
MPPPDPKAEALIERHWDAYRGRVQALFEDIQYKRGGGTSESSMKDHDAMKEELFEALAYNAPPGERSVEEAVAKDRWALLKRLEDPARVRGLSNCVTAPGEHGVPRAFDVAPFYRAAGVLLGVSPLSKGAFQVPPGCRTATRRESGERMVFRASGGKGKVLIGPQALSLDYDYVLVPPEAPYVIENGGKEPLEVEFISIQP